MRQSVMFRDAVRQATRSGLRSGAALDYALASTRLLGRDEVSVTAPTTSLSASVPPRREPSMGSSSSGQGFAGAPKPSFTPEVPATRDRRARNRRRVLSDAETLPNNSEIPTFGGGGSTPSSQYRAAQSTSTAALYSGSHPAMEDFVSGTPKSALANMTSFGQTPKPPTGSTAARLRQGGLIGHGSVLGGDASETYSGERRDERDYRQRGTPGENRPAYGAGAPARPQQARLRMETRGVSDVPRAISDAAPVGPVDMSSRADHYSKLGSQYAQTAQRHTAEHNLRAATHYHAASAAAHSAARHYQMGRLELGRKAVGELKTHLVNAHHWSQNGYTQHDVARGTPMRLRQLAAVGRDASSFGEAFQNATPVRQRVKSAVQQTNKAAAKPAAVPEKNFHPEHPHLEKMRKALHVMRNVARTGFNGKTPLDQDRIESARALFRKRRAEYQHLAGPAAEKIPDLDVARIGTRVNAPLTTGRWGRKKPRGV